jgi:hypothetical protein
MGRPIGKKYIGANRTTDAGGEGVASVTVNGANSYSAGTTISFAVSPIGGTRAAASIAYVIPAVNGLPGNGNVTGVTVTTAGTGYLTAPAITFNKPGNVVVDGVTGFYSLGAAGTVVKFSSGVTTGIYAGMVANVFFTTAAFGSPTRVVSVNTTTGNVTFSSANTSAISSPISFGDVGFGGALTAVLSAAVTTGNTIQANAWIGTTESRGNIADVVSQKGSRRYRITNSVTTGVCTLVANAAIVVAGGPRGAGEMTITATESTGGTYYVYKLDSRTATVWQGTGTQFANLSQVRWSMNAAVANVSVKITTND